MRNGIPLQDESSRHPESLEVHQRLRCLQYDTNELLRPLFQIDSCTDRAYLSIVQIGVNNFCAISCM
jgi:hypothetical protein